MWRHALKSGGTSRQTRGSSTWQQSSDRAQPSWLMSHPAAPARLARGVLQTTRIVFFSFAAEYRLDTALNGVNATRLHLTPNAQFYDQAAQRSSKTALKMQRKYCDKPRSNVQIHTEMYLFHDEMWHLPTTNDPASFVYRIRRCC